MPRVFLPHALAPQAVVRLTGETGHHYARVLRVRSGETVPVAAAGGAWLCRVCAVDPRSGEVELVAESLLPESGPVHKVFLIQALPKGDKMDVIIQKATEIGVAGVLAFAAAHSVTKLSRDRAGAKVARWQRIAAEAASQSQRDEVPSVGFAHDAAEVSAWLAARGVARVWLLDEAEAANHLGRALRQSGPCVAALAVGPEGGWSAADRALFVERFSAQPVSLGRRILRTETAGPVAVALALYEWGDLA
ncbi:ribosomal RNA small subunit methyltransferase E [Alicyclobacillus cellulosilyticus]|uniref:Ribosomal RNA small subunit methyltransferase E n=1 Tax=Alicyclobacillus cellulosilyticus TaxID=1003997 RepID=A0A917KEE0_9BACL|nr:RsmE family RNA methyltransferase [Alicyclobacillus cellulosilyticus]GGJ09324.1 ribosomal RNA small subunit methyltransferase E [Alicyclobacillus cellulosilyticus]